MFPSLPRFASRRALAAGLAAVVAAAGFGVAIAEPEGAGSTSVTDVAAGALSSTSLVSEEPEKNAPPSDSEAPTTQAQEPDAGNDLARPSSLDVGSPRPAQDTNGPSAGPLPVPTGDPQVPPSLDDIEDRVDGSAGPGSSGPGDAAEGVASSVIARIQACVGDSFDFEDFEDFDGSGSDAANRSGRRGAGGGGGSENNADVGQSFATGVVEDVLPCVAGLVDDTLRCVSGLVEEIFEVVMSMDFERIIGMSDVIVDELVACVANAD